MDFNNNYNAQPDGGLSRLSTRFRKKQSVPVKGEGNRPVSSFLFLSLSRSLSHSLPLSLQLLYITSIETLYARRDCFRKSKLLWFRVRYYRFLIINFFLYTTRLINHRKEKKENIVVIRRFESSLSSLWNSKNPPPPSPSFNSFFLLLLFQVSKNLPTIFASLAFIRLNIIYNIITHCTRKRRLNSARAALQTYFIPETQSPRALTVGVICFPPLTLLFILAAVE